MKARVIAAVSIAASLLLATASLSSAQGQLPRPGNCRPRRPGRTAAARTGRAAAQPPASRRRRPPSRTSRCRSPRPRPSPIRASRPSASSSARSPSKKDRKALAGLVAPNFFWMGEKGDKADKKKPGVENLAKAIQLDGKEAPGWEMLGAAAADPTGTPFPDRKDTICSPADPTFNAQEFEALAKSTGTEEGDWAYPTQTGLEVHAGPQPNSPVVEKLGLHFVRVMQDTAPGSQDSPMLQVVTPSGKTGFVPAEALSPLGNDQLCYSKEGGGWKISGFIGGDQ